MDKKQIKALYKRLDECIVNDQSDTDNLMAQLGTNAGWKEFNKMVDSMIVELLQPVEFKDSTSLEVRALVHEKRAFGIEVLRKAMLVVDSVIVAKAVEKEQKNIEEKEVENKK